MFPSTLGNIGVIELEQIKSLIVKALESLINEIINTDYPISVNEDVTKIKDFNKIFDPIVNILL